ncbi:MAG: patatin-like phospholipase family protein [Alphaproteobacteria bacterium]|nr:patatin-like phospholipase family protein [Alphaproteobacteria bacterium]
MSDETTDVSPTTRPNRLQDGGALTRKPTIGLALGGGGARGLAHILMLEVLDEMGIRPTVIAGTSIGAIFGAAYASGYSAAQIRAHTEELLRSRFEILRQFFMARQEPLGRVLNVLQLRSALLNAEALLDLVMPPRIARDFTGFEIPLRVVAADFYTQDQVVLTTGSTHRAIAASMALPALFAPVISEEFALMDGGLVNPLPFDVISGQADIIVAINVSGAGRLPEDRTPPKAIESLFASLQILQHTIVREKLLSRKPDVLIDVDVGAFHVLDFHKLAKVLKAASPAKQELRFKLERILSAETLETDDTPPPELEEPEPSKRARLAQRLLGQSR